MSTAEIDAGPAISRSELLDAVERAVRDASAEESHATVQTILDWLGPEVLGRLRERYRTDLQTAVGNLCRSLVRSGRIKSLGFVGQVRAFAPAADGGGGSSRTATTTTVLSDNAPLSRRKYLFDVVRKLCLGWGGAIRVGQIREALGGNEGRSPASATEDESAEEQAVRAGLLEGVALTATLQSLASTNHLLIAGRVRGKRSGGTHLWVPVDFPGGLPARYAEAPEPLRPGKPSTPREESITWQILDTVHHLVERGEWPLVTTRDVRRAMPAHFGRRTSKFGGKRPISKLIDAALRIPPSEGESKRPHIARVGQVAAVTYYTTLDRLEEARASLGVRELFARYSEDALRDATRAASRIASTACFIARTSMLEAHIRRAFATSEEFGVNPHLGEAARTALDLYQARLTESASQLQEEREDRGFRDDVATDENLGSPSFLRPREMELISLADAAAFAERIAAGSVAPPSLESITKQIAVHAARADTWVGPALRQRRPFGRGEEARFDAVSVRMLVATKYAGHETRRQARIADLVLGPLRDEQVLLAALTETKIDARLEAVAGLAFLRTPAGVAALRNAVHGDPVPAIRELALWGYGVSGADDPRQLASEVAAHDADGYVRRMAEEYLRVVDSDVRGWWGL